MQDIGTTRKSVGTFLCRIFLECMHIWSELKRSHHILRETCTNIRTMHSRPGMSSIFLSFCPEMIQTPHDYRMLSAIKYLGPIAEDNHFVCHRIQRIWIHVQQEDSPQLTSVHGVRRCSACYQSRKQITTITKLQTQMTYGKDLPAKHTGAIVAQMLYE